MIWTIIYWGLFFAALAMLPAGNGKSVLQVMLDPVTRGR